MTIFISFIYKISTGAMQHADGIIPVNL